MKAEKSKPLLYIGNMCAAQQLYESYEYIKTGFSEFRCLTFMSHAEFVSWPCIKYGIKFSGFKLEEYF